MPKPNLVLQWFRESRVYLKEFGKLLLAAGAILTPWEKLFGAEYSIPQSLRWVVLAVAMLLALWFNVIPALRKDWEEKERPTGTSAPGYFKTTPRDANDPYGFFTGKNAAGYEPFLDWLKNPKSGVLHLTGLSGVGKSSLITAYLAPELMKSAPPARLVAVRTSEDPESALKDALAVEFWKKRPVDWDAIMPMESLDRAVGRIESGERLIVVFDQFEEFFLLGAEARHATSPVISPDHPRLIKLAAFLRTFLSNPSRRVTVVLSYREDHAALLEPLNLPARNEGANWKRLDPFRCEQACRFLNGVPDFQIPGDRLARVIAEAVGYERDKVFVRPIVANLLGLVLEWMKDHPTFWKHRADLLRHYVRLKLGREIVAERSALLRAMITDFETARPRTAAKLAITCGLSPAVLSNQLENLASAGLVRCLSDDTTPPAQKEWQIAHDFVATLCERVIDATHRSIWRNLKRWIAPCAIALWLILVLGAWPLLKEHSAIATLAGAGFSWDESRRLASISNLGIQQLASLDGVHEALTTLKPREINLDGCSALTNCEGLNGVTSLESLDLSNCLNLQDLKGLKGLTSLQSLFMGNCMILNNLEVLRGLTSLKSLDLRGCKFLTNVEGLKGLTSLRYLDLSGCKILANFEGVKELTSLQRLDISDCDVTDVDVKSIIECLPRCWITLPDGRDVNRPSKDEPSQPHRLKPEFRLDR